MNEDDFIAWLAMQRGKFTLSKFGRIRHESGGVCYCPLQYLTGSEIYYEPRATLFFDMDGSLIDIIIEASDQVTSSPFRKRMLDALELS